MTMSTVTVRVDEQTKKRAASVLADIGLDLSTAVRVFLKQVAVRGQMPIELLQDPFYSQSNQAVLRDSITQADRGETLTKSMAELEEMVR